MKLKINPDDLLETIKANPGLKIIEYANIFDLNNPYTLKYAKNKLVKIGEIDAERGPNWTRLWPKGTMPERVAIVADSGCKSLMNQFMSRAFV